jgi:hypothetical protein
VQNREFGAKALPGNHIYARMGHPHENPRRKRIEWSTLEECDVDATQGRQEFTTDEFLSGKRDSDLLFGEQAVGGHSDRNDKHCAQKNELGAGSQLLEHGGFSIRHSKRSGPLIVISAI